MCGRLEITGRRRVRCSWREWTRGCETDERNLLELPVPFISDRSCSNDEQKMLVKRSREGRRREGYPLPSRTCHILLRDTREAFLQKDVNWPNLKGSDRGLGILKGCRRAEGRFLYSRHERDLGRAPPTFTIPSSSIQRARRKGIEPPIDHNGLVGVKRGFRQLYSSYFGRHQEGWGWKLRDAIPSKLGPRRNGSHSRRGRSLIFACGNCTGRSRWPVGFLRDLSFSTPLGAALLFHLASPPTALNLDTLMMPSPHSSGVGWPICCRRVVGSRPCPAVADPQLACCTVSASRLQGFGPLFFAKVPPIHFLSGRYFSSVVPDCSPGTVSARASNNEVARSRPIGTPVMPVAALLTLKMASGHASRAGLSRRRQAFAWVLCSPGTGRGVPIVSRPLKMRGGGGQEACITSTLAGGLAPCQREGPAGAKFDARRRGSFFPTPFSFTLNHHRFAIIFSPCSASPIKRERIAAHGGAVARLLAYHHGESDSIPGGVDTNIRTWETWKTLPLAMRSRGGVVVRLLAYHPSEPGSIRGRLAPGSSLVGIVPDDATGRRVFSWVSRFPPAPAFRRRSTITSLYLQRLSVPTPFWSALPQRPRPSIGTLFTCGIGGSIFWTGDVKVLAEVITRPAAHAILCPGRRHSLGGGDYTPRCPCYSLTQGDVKVLAEVITRPRPCYSCRATHICAVGGSASQTIGGEPISSFLLLFSDSNPGDRLTSKVVLAGVTLLFYREQPISSFLLLFSDSNPGDRLTSKVVLAGVTLLFYREQPISSFLLLVSDSNPGDRITPKVILAGATLLFFVSRITFLDKFSQGDDPWGGEGGLVLVGEGEGGGVNSPLADGVRSRDPQLAKPTLRYQPLRRTPRLLVSAAIGRSGHVLVVTSSRRGDYRPRNHPGIISEKTCRSTASSGTIPTCENPVTRPGIEPSFALVGGELANRSATMAPNRRGGGAGDPRENPPTGGIVRHDSHVGKFLEHPSPGIGPGSPWWEASSQTTTPRLQIVKIHLHQRIRQKLQFIMFLKNIHTVPPLLDAAAFSVTVPSSSNRK
ncbi:hypothetical protein PR048_022262 [Dryococelus australis]|uniref:Uncharacterized protein n=1 Tax=Dryococelus australis TaxID=614101 RepID=A0ABQ9H0K3_9NEOP|nr:hypothetical protein PR048_022262 [Dryococelus australis]